MRTVIISDVHANLEALETVLEDVAGRAHDRIICLGDVIGYGPDPCACIDLVEQHCEFSLLGNHDYACLYEPTNFNPIAVQGSYWTRAQFEPEGDGLRNDDAARRQAYLHLMRTFSYLDDDRDYLLVHASPKKPLSEYLFQDDVQKASKITGAFSAMRGGAYAFVGHTHVPGVFSAERDQEGRISIDSLYEFDYANELEGPFELDTCDGRMSFIVNPGSVGQPRDGDPRASYAILDTSGPVPTVEFTRIAYSAETTRAKIHANRHLGDRLGDRLIVGE
ncbi:MAG: metallophosphatase family protein [Phycisphaerales bacterium]|nr:metallophosphatase family protein [Phycisphaerales bacterium]